MSMSELWNSITRSDLIAVFGTISLVIGGAALIASGRLLFTRLLSSSASIGAADPTRRE